MASYVNSDEIPEKEFENGGSKNKINQDISVHAGDDQNLTCSILEELGNSHVSDSSVDLQLRFQRLLAESALESSTLDTSKNPRISSDEFMLGTSTPQLCKSSSSIFGSSNKNDDYEALFKKYYSEDFTPAENAADRLMADEIAWKKEYGSVPAVNEKLNLSCFSGIIGDAEISLGSVTGVKQFPKNKITAEEYFNLRANQMGSLETILSNKDRPNFGNDIESPSTNRERIAFVQDSIQEATEKPKNSVEEPANNIVIETTVSQSGNLVDLNVTPNEESCSMLSMTSIEDFLSKHLQDTPGTIAKNILNTKCKTKSTLNQDGSVSTLAGRISGFSDNLVEKCPTELHDSIHVDVPKSEYEAYVGTNLKVPFQIQSKSTRWLKCKMSGHQLVYNKIYDAAVEKEMISHMKFPEVTLIGPSQKTIQKVVVTPTVPGHFEIFVNIIVEDAVTQSSKNFISGFRVISKMPKVEIQVEGKSANEVDFGTIPEGCCQVTFLEIRNYADSHLPMVLSLEEVSSNTHAFALCKNDADNKAASLSSEDEERSLKVSVAFKPPSIKDCTDVNNGFVNFSAYLNVAINFGERSCLLKKLLLKGSVGVTQLLLNFHSSVELTSPGPGIPDSKTMLLKNGGVVTLNLKLLIVDPTTFKLDSESVITVNNPAMQVLPGKEAAFTIVFTPTWVFKERVNRKLVIHVLPNGNLFEVDIIAKMTDGNRGQGKERLSSQSTDTAPSEGFTSASSSRSLTGMPVQTTHKYLVWTTVPVGKSETQSLRLRNDWPSTVKVVLSLVDLCHGFWLLNENGEHVLERKLRLHSKECVPVNVMFSPTKIGVANGKIVICESKRLDSAERFAIPLTGYSGTFNLTVRNVPKDKSGNMWINLGPLDSKLNTRFTVCNKGNLESFAYVKYVPKGIGALLQGVTVNIQPKKTVIAPGSNETIQVSFALHNDMSFIAKDRRDVLELGNLYVTCGDEPTRQRIRRIKEKRGNQAVSSVLELDTLCSIFPGETTISELKSLNDPESAIRSLWRTLQQHEIAMTAECYDDRSVAMQTIVGNGNIGNQSLIFKSMLPDATFSSSVTESSGRKSPTWSITPSNLTLLVPRFASGCITIASTHEDEQMFEICSTEDVLSVEPSSGIIPGMGEVVAVVTCSTAGITALTNIKSVLKVYLENDMKTVTVHIKPAPESLVPRNKGNISSSDSDLSSAKGAKNESNKKKINKAPQDLGMLHIKK